MFDFYGRTIGRNYLIWTAVSIGLFIASFIVFPFIAMGLAKATNCSSVNGACGAVGVILAMLVKPLVAGIVLFSFIAPAARRARDAGLAPWLGLFVPLLFLADYEFFIFGGASWGFAFSMGVLGLSMPVHALVGIVAAIALGLLPTSEGDIAPGRFGLLAWAVAIGAGVVTLLTLLNFSSLLPMSDLLRFAAPVLGLLRRAEIFILIGVGVLLIVSAIIVRRAPPSPVDRLTDDPLRLPIFRLLLLAIVLAAVATALVLPGRMAQMGGLAIVVLPFVALPTAILYFLPLLGGTLLLKGRTVSGGVLCLIFAAFMASWGYQHWQAWEVRQETHQIAAVLPTREPPPVYPSTMFMDLDFNRNPFPEIEGVTRRIYRGHDKKGLYSRSLEGDDWSSPVEIAELPHRYLLIRAGDRGGPDEHIPYLTRTSYVLSVMNHGHESVIEEYYAATLEPPTWLPVAGLYRWETVEPARSGDRTAPLQVFVSTALAGVPSEPATVE